MEKKISMKEIGNSLLSYAYRNGKESVQVFNDFLRYCCDLAEWNEIVRAGGLVERMKEMQKENNTFFDCFTALCKISYEHNRMGEAYDALGSLYEESFQSASKASRTGQFFTPQDLCRLMADITMQPEPADVNQVVAYNDCACGSGRTLLAAWEKCDKYRKNYFAAGDVDPMSVMMCALNFMLNGMVGIVECQNALTQEWHHGYIVNACKVPKANNMPCLERYDDRSQFRARERKLMLLMSIWDVSEHRPAK